MIIDYVYLIAILATIFGTLMAFANFLQAYRIHRRKSSSDISILTFFIFFIGSIIWFLYGLSISSNPVIITNLVGVFSTASVVVLYYRHN